MSMLAFFVSAIGRPNEHHTNRFSSRPLLDNGHDLPHHRRFAFNLFLASGEQRWSIGDWGPAVCQFQTCAWGQ